MALGHMVSDNIFYICCKKLYKTNCHNLNKLGKEALSDATTLWILFYAFPIKAYEKTRGPQDGSILATWA